MQELASEISGGAFRFTVRGFGVLQESARIWFCLPEAAAKVWACEHVTGAQ